MKSLKFECPSCQQRIEASWDFAGKSVTCPSCQFLFVAPKPNRQVSRICLLIVLTISALAVLGYKLHKRQMDQAADMAEERNFLKSINPERFEERYETQMRWRAEFEAGMGRECSNWVGFTRMRDAYVLTHGSDNPTNWSGSATLDYVNKRGGVERTNLLFICISYEHHVNAILNEGAMWDRYYSQR
jgi:hypothetical protein